MEQKVEAEVLISGAGSSGLTLAIELARRYIPFRLIDKLLEPFPGSRGKAIMPRSQEIFEAIGIMDRMAAWGRPYPPMKEYTPDGLREVPFMERREATPSEPYSQTMMIPQFLTESLLRERLAELGHTPEFGHELIEFVADEEGVTARIKGAPGVETFRARYLVGADGGRSFVRNELQVGFPGESLAARAIVADIALHGLNREIWHCWNRQSPRQLYICPLPGTPLFQLQAPISLEGEPDLSVSGVMDLIAERTGRSDISVTAVNWASAYNLSARLAEAYRIGRVFLSGDAAHVHPPTGGQGLNTSIQDAYNLGWKLASVIAGAPEALLATYEEERRPVAAGMLGLATGLLRAAREKGEMRRGRETHQMDVGYVELSLSLDRNQRPMKLQAGNRAPDAPCRGGAGQRKRLFDIFRGTHWTLLGYETNQPNWLRPMSGLRIHRIGSDGDIVDDDDCIRETYDLEPGDWVLVRPDGYIGAIADGAGVGCLEAYFERVGIRSPDERTP